MHEFKKKTILFFQFFSSFIWFACFLCFALFFHIPIQEYTEEFRDIAGKSKKLGGPVTDQGITLINQRHVGDDLPVILFYFFFHYCNSSFCFLLLQKSREKEHVYDAVYESKSHSSVSFLREIDVHTRIECFVFLLRKYFVKLYVRCFWDLSPVIFKFKLELEIVHTKDRLFCFFATQIHCKNVYCYNCT